MDRERETGESRHDIVVIGASAGGIEPLMALVAELPAELPAAVFVVVHMPPTAPSRLPEVLSRTGALPATHAVDGEAIVPGRIYVARPDRHLLVRRGVVEVSRGPRENHSRPAIDPLFRSAARAYGARVAGVVLSGALYDGSAGLMAITARGGLAMVQAAGEATVPSMPRRAAELVEAAIELPAVEIGRKLARLARDGGRVQGDVTMIDEEEHLQRVIDNDFAEQAHNERVDETTVYTCPECGGVLWQAADELGNWFRCHVGHAYAPEALLGQKSEEVEATLWACIRLLREKATLTRQAAARSIAEGNGNVGARIDEQAQLIEQQSVVLRELLEAMPSPADLMEARRGIAFDVPGATG